MPSLTQHADTSQVMTTRKFRLTNLVSSDAVDKHSAQPRTLVIDVLII